MRKSLALVSIIIILGLIQPINTVCNVCSRCTDCDTSVIADDYINDIDALLQSKTTGIGYPLKIKKI